MLQKYILWLIKTNLCFIKSLSHAYLLYLISELPIWIPIIKYIHTMGFHELVLYARSLKKKIRDFASKNQFSYDKYQRLTSTCLLADTYKLLCSILVIMIFFIYRIYGLADIFYIVYIVALI